MSCEPRESGEGEAWWPLPRRSIPGLPVPAWTFPSRCGPHGRSGSWGDPQLGCSQSHLGAEAELGGLEEQPDKSSWAFGGFHQSRVLNVTSERCADISRHSSVSGSPHGTRLGTGEVMVAGMQRGRGSALVGWHRHPYCHSMLGLSHHHLLHLSAAHSPSPRQETTAFPLASPTLGKPPRQLGEQISRASRARTEPPPRRAAPERLGFAAWHLTLLWPGANPPVLCQLCPWAACWGAAGPGTGSCWPGGQERREGVMGRITHWWVHSSAGYSLSWQRQSSQLPWGQKT